MNITGFSDRIAVFSRPLASAGVDGITTVSPGIWANQDSKVCEWVAASCPQPAGVRTTSGIVICPPNMKRIFALLLTILVIASPRRPCHVAQGVPYGEDVVPVDPDRRDIERTRLPIYVLDRGSALDRRAHPVAVVFDDDAEGQFPKCRHVQAGEERAGVGGAVAQET